MVAATAAAGSENVLARPRSSTNGTSRSASHANVAGGADAREEVERLVVAAEHQVLAVVHAFAGRRVGERRRAPAERRPRLEDGDADARVGKRRRRAQARESAADDEHIRHGAAKPPTYDRISQCKPIQSKITKSPNHQIHRLGHIPRSDLPQSESAITARRGRGTRIFRENTS